MKTDIDITPFDNCPALGGYHCQTNSLAKIFHYNGRPISEDMLLGIDAGMGFIYWHQKGMSPFIGGRGNKNFFQDLGKRVGVRIGVKSTSSERKAESSILEKLSMKQPVMVYGDMGFLPWFDLPEGYHFGGHMFVICGYDGEETLLASDIDQKASGFKAGFYYSITLEQLRKARASQYKPYPPKNTYLEFDFSAYHPPTVNDVYSAINQTVESMINAPISNLGVRGIRRSANEITKWPHIFEDMELRMNLFTIYVFIEISEIGGGCFRYMYSRFLKEAAQITSNQALEKAASMIHESGKRFTELGLLFKDSETVTNLEERLTEGSGRFVEIAEMEEEAFIYLSENIPKAR